MLRIPIRLGGFGLPSMLDMAPLAYISSVSALMNQRDLPAFAHLQDSFDAWLTAPAPDSNARQPWPGAGELGECLANFHHRMEQTRTIHPNMSTQLSDNPTILPMETAHLPLARPKLQQRLSRLWHTALKMSLVDDAGVQLRARLMGLSQRGASAVLHTIPSCAELTLNNEEYVSFLKIHQGLMEFDTQTRILCPCAGPGGRVAYPATHAELCRGGRGFQVRHDITVQSIAQALRSVGLVVQSNYHPNGPRQNPDLEVFDFPFRGTVSFVEFAVTSAQQANIVDRAANEPLAAATRCEAKKRRKYADLVRDTNRALFPCVIEAGTGAFSRGLQEVISLAAALARRSSTAVTAPRRTFSSRKPKDFMTQCIAVSFVRGSLRMEKSTTEWRAFQREPAAASTAVESAPLAFPHDGLTHPVSPTQPSGLPEPVSSVHPTPLAPARLHQGVDALTDDSPLLSPSPSPFSLRAGSFTPSLQ